MRTHAEWNVDTHILSATGPTSARTRERISSAALLVNVMARMRKGLTPSSVIEVGDAVGEHPGLARSRSGDHQQGPVAVDDGVELVGVEAVGRGGHRASILRAGCDSDPGATPYSRAASSEKRMNTRSACRNRASAVLAIRQHRLTIWPENGRHAGSGRGDCPSVEPVLDARALVKRFGDVDAVNDVSVTVAPGERVGFLGPNGAGKTTTLLMLLGAITPDEGTISLCGHRLPRGRSKAMEQVGFAAGYLPLPERLRVKEALGVFAGLYGVRDERAAAAEALERFRHPHLADRLCNELSSGQRTLVGIAKAILHRPRLLVLDEPTASLDPDVAMRVRGGLLDVLRAGRHRPARHQS